MVEANPTRRLRLMMLKPNISGGEETVYKDNVPIGQTRRTSDYEYQIEFDYLNASEVIQFSNIWEFRVGELISIADTD